MQAAVETSLIVLEMHKWVSMPSFTGRRGRGLSTGPDKAATASSPAAGKEGAPPYSLMEHPMLAILTNGLLSALNELRHCAPLSMQHTVAAVLTVCPTSTVLLAPWTQPPYRQRAACDNQQIWILPGGGASPAAPTYSIAMKLTQYLLRCNRVLGMLTCRMRWRQLRGHWRTTRPPEP